MSVHCIAKFLIVLSVAIVEELTDVGAFRELTPMAICLVLLMTWIVIVSPITLFAAADFLIVLLVSAFASVRISAIVLIRAKSLVAIAKLLIFLLMINPWA